MAKRDNEYTGKNWREGDLIDKFQLQRNSTEYTELMKTWLNVSEPPLDAMEQALFDRILLKALKNIDSWNEEDLKMKFIAFVLELARFTDDNKIIGFFDRIISARVQGIPLTVKSDFMYAQGTFDVFRTPYFHFQEYKPHKHPSGDSMAQLIEAFLIVAISVLETCDTMGERIRRIRRIGTDFFFDHFHVKSKKNPCKSARSVPSVLPLYHAFSGT